MHFLVKKTLKNNYKYTLYITYANSHVYQTIILI